MNELNRKTAVVTGAASGLGLAMARAFCREGMRVVLVDLPGMALERALASLVEEGGDALAIATDVADAGAVDVLAERIDALGGVDLLCNNAGITGDRPRASWAHDLSNWRRVLDVNLMGVIHGLHSFVPRMIASGRPGHIVNTASMGGLMAIPFIAPYVAAKAALVALSESLAMELRAEGTAIGVSVLCPGMVRSGLTGPGRDHRQSTAQEPSAAARQFQARTQETLANARLSADDVATALIAAIREDRFYVLTHEGSLELAGQRWQRLNHEQSIRNRSPQA
ncbi:SDR family NAD(P)-dependent oxidoreductase [Pseudomonas nitroreducens]|uniref:SDR family NAD(P)-dependent oxidoreductase n=1 Tax=Pseudomonas nitroreducens TaxID=46680 RepID=A0A6G6J3B6_PSENT|nr:SDR family NAD(P)-dependent oxidoreductase [Pseudomonas nitroreducens]QIE89809.1 SDR family NAD(P)-dependent oxidoreductase [Pseudomonas nitroreducens]